MAKPRVYIETTFVSYLTAWPSRDVVMHGHQQLTREWWEKRRDQFDLCTSAAVVREASGGDPEAARQRLAILATLPVVETMPEALELAAELLSAGALPRKATEDALHIAVAATNGAAYLLTWNCKHLANATMRDQITAICLAAGYQAPKICSPVEFSE